MKVELTEFPERGNLIKTLKICGLSNWRMELLRAVVEYCGWVCLGGKINFSGLDVLEFRFSNYTARWTCPIGSQMFKYQV